MKTFEYNYENFKAVEKILALTETAPKTGGFGRIVFNDTKNRFEFYDEKEVESMDIHQSYSSVREAIQRYIALSDNNDPNAENELIPDTESLEDVNNEEEIIILDDAEDQPTEEDPVIAFDEVFENSQKTLKVIRDIQDKVNLERQEKLLQVISDLFKMDTVSESDILKTLVENTELKKLLSLVFETFGVEVSKTVSTHDLKVSTATIKFSHKIENTIDDYKRGISQALANIRAIKASREEIETMKTQVADAQKLVAVEKRTNAELTRQIAVLTEKKDPIRELHNIAPLIYVVCWKTEKGTVDYLRVRKDKLTSATEDGSFPTKYLERTSHLGKAQHFTNATAKAQIDKIIKHKGNVTFMKLDETSSRQLKEFFTIGRVAVEKIQAVNSVNE